MRSPVGALKAAWVVALVAGPAFGSGLLDGRLLTQTDGGQGLARLTDGIWEKEGGFWAAPTAVVLSPSSYVEWDLGEVAAIAAINLQADNNDDYLLWVSEDGKAFTVAWRSGTKPEPGLRLREGRGGE